MNSSAISQPAAVELNASRLVACYNAEHEGLSEAALPLLEDLELSLVSYSGVAGAGLEAIGRHSPRLKSLKVNGLGCEYPGDDEPAQSIAKTMPGLRHLQLVTNRLTNAGLDAILSGCPHLEDLDIRKCLHLDLTGELEKRCEERIKNLKRPSDPIYDFEYLAELQQQTDNDDLWHSNLMFDIEYQNDDDGHNDYYGSDSDYGGDRGGSLADEDLDFY